MLHSRFVFYSWAHTGPLIWRLMSLFLGSFLIWSFFSHSYFVCCIFLDFWLVSILIIYWLVTNHSKNLVAKTPTVTYVHSIWVTRSERTSLLLHVWPHWQPTPKGAHTVSKMMLASRCLPEGLPEGPCDMQAASWGGRSERPKQKQPRLIAKPQKPHSATPQASWPHKATLFTWGGDQSMLENKALKSWAEPPHMYTRIMQNTSLGPYTYTRHTPGAHAHKQIPKANSVKTQTPPHSSPCSACPKLRKRQRPCSRRKPWCHCRPSASAHSAHPSQQTPPLLNPV